MPPLELGIPTDMPSRLEVDVLDGHLKDASGKCTEGAAVPGVEVVLVPEDTKELQALANSNRVTTGRSINCRVQEGRVGMNSLSAVN